MSHSRRQTPPWQEQRQASKGPQPQKFFAVASSLSPVLVGASLSRNCAIAPDAANRASALLRGNDGVVTAHKSRVKRSGHKSVAQELRTYSAKPAGVAKQKGRPVAAPS